MYDYGVVLRAAVLEGYTAIVQGTDSGTAAGRVTPDAEGNEDGR